MVKAFIVLVLRIAAYADWTSRRLFVLDVFCVGVLICAPVPLSYAFSIFVALAPPRSLQLNQKDGNMFTDS